MQRIKFLGAALLLTSALVGGVRAADGDGALTPAAAGPDFAIQGEYVGTVGDEKCGAQVIALGEGAFQAVFLPGGLPGAGWDGKTRIRVGGKTEGEKTLFRRRGRTWTGTLQNGQFEGKTEKGVAFSLKPVRRESPTLGAKPPQDAVVLFDGKNADAWVNGQVTPEGWLQQGVQTKEGFQNFTLHIEFMTSFMPLARGQGRSNSGVFLDGRYEVQVLDSFGLDGLNNECGSIYSIKAPDVNMCLPPLSWQTYDIDYTAPTFDADGKKLKDAVVTVKHNGVVVHDKVEIPKTTAGGQEGPTAGPIQFMNHGNPLRARNIWLVKK
jgi:hypothetical protein